MPLVSLEERLSVAYPVPMLQNASPMRAGALDIVLG
jgi:hypothetical protein